MSHEIELKLSLPRAALPALRRHPVFAAAVKQGNAVTLENTYYDTPGLDLKARKVALRTRRHGRTWLQTVKCAAESVGGLTRRPEWEQRYGGAFDFTGIDAPKVRKLLERHADAVVPVFTTRFRRETRLHAPADGKRILLMLDTGEVRAGERNAPICELELELAEGDPLDLLLLACELAAGLPLLPDDVSKAERGFRLHLDTPLTPARAVASHIDAGQSPLAAFRSLAGDCLRQWQANAVGAAASEDPEFIHQLRVALRRLRSLLPVFAPVLPPQFVADWNERLSRNADDFGEARDLDVLYDELLAPLVEADSHEDAAIARLVERVRAARDAAREAVRHKLDPAAQGRLLIGFTAALCALPDHPGESEALPAFARRQLDRLRKRMRQRHEAATDLAPAHLHALRIAGKRLRYAVEFFIPLMPAKAAGRYLDGLTRVLSALGFVNDVDVARTRLLARAGDDAELRAAAAFVLGWHGPRYARLARRAMRELEPLLSGKTPWGR